MKLTMRALMSITLMTSIALISTSLTSTSQAFAASSELTVHYLYDAQSGQHFLGLGVSASDRLAVDEGVAFTVSTTQLPGTVGLYRCLSVDSSQYFVSKKVDCGGAITESLLGYVSASNP